MKIFTDSVCFAERLLGKDRDWKTERQPVEDEHSDIRTLIESLIPGEHLYSVEIDSRGFWKYILLVEKAPESQYDVLIRLAQRGVKFPDGILCLADEGSGFHGFKNRPWKSLSGNIHLTAYLSPDRPVPNFGAVFMALPAVSALQVIDQMPGLENRAGIKWVNDILVEESKICGVLAHSQSMGETVSTVILGIGFNVETKPEVERNRFVPQVASLLDFVGDASICNQAQIFYRLKEQLEKNYSLIRSGEQVRLIDLYRERSNVIGKQVVICFDDECEDAVSGKAVDIGENLELYLEGLESPISRGRLAFISST
jgi:biotin-[acetyl-CoA-carboxylase] ligase BirA-like protein